MTVKELIEKLRLMPQDAKVYHLWDAEPRTEINVVYEAKNGSVVTADYEMQCYSTENRPKNAPVRAEQSYWETEKDPNGEDFEDD